MLSKGQFYKKMISFCLKDAINEVIGMMKMRANLKGIQLFYDENKEEDYNLFSNENPR